MQVPDGLVPCCQQTLHLAYDVHDVGNSAQIIPFKSRLTATLPGRVNDPGP